MITYSKEKPAIYDTLVKAFGIDWNDGVIITYGDHVHCKHTDIGPYKKVHESVHVKQQAEDKNTWWSTYIANKNFRLEQELEAYRAEWLAYTLEVKDRNKRARYLHQIAVDLSSPMYGGIITLEEAKKAIAN